MLRSLCMLLMISLSANSAFAQYRISSWTATTPLPTPQQGAKAISYGDHIVLLTGSGGTYVGDVGVGGQVVSWRPSQPLPRLPYGNVARVGDFLVVPLSPSSFVGHLAPDGSIASWATAPGTANLRILCAAAADGSRIYSVSGGNSGILYTDVEVASIDANGALSSWRPLTPIPAYLNDAQATVMNGFLYVFGGESWWGDMSVSRDVRRSAIQPDGTIGQWEFVGYLRDPRPHSAFVGYNDTIHIIAGGVHSYMTSTVESVVAGQLGNTSQHIYSEPLPTLLNELAATVVRNYAYVIGGNAGFYGGGAQRAVYMAKVADQPPNRAPVAEAGPDQTLEAVNPTSTPVTLDGSGSSDPDGDPLIYTWTGSFGTLTGQVVSTALPLGRHTITLTVSDGKGGTATDTVAVTVQDTSPPVIWPTVTPLPNAAGWNNSDVTIRWSVSDPGSGIALSSNCETVTLTSETAGTTVTCSATNGAGLSNSSSVTIKIDKTPPTLACSANPSTLWPPNHQMVPVKTSVNVSDVLWDSSGFVLASVTSNEPDNGLGDGDQPDDIQRFVIGAPSVDGLLRAERSGTGDGRVYTLIYRAVDKAGNAGSCSTTVRVPHEQGK